MFAGHLAVAMAAKRVEPKLGLGSTVAAAFALDLAWPILLLLGIERVRVNPGDTAFTNLAFESYPWTHSLAMVLVWSVCVAVAVRLSTRATRPAFVLGMLVLSHWVLDWITHRPDLPFWPGGPVTGLGVWNSVLATILVEGGLLVVGVALYLSTTESRDRTGVVALLGLIALTAAVWVSQPWAPLPESADAVAWGALVLWLLWPWATWVDRHRRVRSSFGPGGMSVASDTHRTTERNRTSP
jgi:membrane-bound metal-dependent hydrolase YbcI (DUF457 family)